MSEHVVPLKVYLGIFAALMGLTFLTVYVAYLDLGPWNLFVALAIAVVKALLVVLWFMHVRYSSRLTWMFAAAGLLWIGILFTLTLSDDMTRG